MPILKTSNVLTAMVAVLRVPEEPAILAVHAALPWLRRSISAEGAKPVLPLFQRDDCHLCDMALAELAKLAGEAGTKGIVVAGSMLRSRNKEKTGD